MTITTAGKLKEAKRERDEATGRLCVVCGKVLPASHDRTKSPANCATPEACTIDLTTSEAVAHWRQKAHSQRSRAEAAEARIAALEGALKRLMLGYVTLIESGRDRIIQLGGTCDDVTTMEAADPFLREARAALASAPKGGDHG